MIFVGVVLDEKILEIDSEVRFEGVSQYILLEI